MQRKVSRGFVAALACVALLIAPASWAAPRVDAWQAASWWNAGLSDLVAVWQILTTWWGSDPADEEETGGTAPELSGQDEASCTASATLLTAKHGCISDPNG